MFIENKYSKCYYSIVNRAKSRIIDSNIYTEKHHIIPKSVGGTNLKENLVKLTAREHFICHLLLPKMLVGSYRHKMVHALWRMCNSLNSEYKINARTYKLSKEQHSWVMSNIGHQGQFKMGRPTWNKGIPRTAEVKQAISKANYGRETGRTSDTFTDEWKNRISNSKKGKSTWNKGVTHSDVTKKLQSDIAKNRAKKTCPYCSTETSPGNYARWHGDNCRDKP
jgi:hypothetical protein